MLWNNSAHIGPADGASVIEVFWGNGAPNGRKHDVYPGAFSETFARREWECLSGGIGYIPLIGYESASSLGRTIAIENSGQAVDYAGDSVSRPIFALKNRQTTNGLWCQTWGTTSPFAWVKSDGLARFTSLELPEGTPANPAADNLRLYAKDVAGITKLAYRDSAGLETVVGPGGITIAQAAPGTTLTGSTAETTLATLTIPAAILGASGQFELESFMSSNASVGTKTLRVYFGGVLFYAFSPNSTGLGVQQKLRIANKTTGTQTSYSVSTAGTGFGTTTVAATTSSIDTTAAVTVLITGQLSNGADTMALESYTALAKYAA